MLDQPKKRRALFGSASAAALMGIGRIPKAQTNQTATLPNGPVRILVGFPPGGGSDVMARHIAEKLKDRLGRNVLIENKAGASGTIAIDAMKTAPADGSVLMYGTSATTVAQLVTRKTPSFDLEKDLTPISLTGTVGVVYVVSSTLGVNTIAEYVEWLKKNPQKASFGTTALGSATHFSGVELGQALGIPLLPVAYKGAAPLVGDLLAGHIPAGCGGLTDFLVHQQSGKVKIIAITSAKRATSAPDVPTVAELGYPKLSYDGFYGFYGPGKMSPAMVSFWNRELRAVTDSPELSQRLLGLGLEVQTSTPTEMAARQSRLLTSFTASMKAAGYVPD
jgi:tripartite-type tricarboxylate transporter receptor subunit TctC